VARAIWHTRSPSETDELAAALARALHAGDWIGLRGGLGAGKTTLVRSLAVHLGVDPELVSSPTYVLINEYPVCSGSADQGRSPCSPDRILHADAYRAHDGAELLDAGLDDADPEAVVLIEWADRVADAMPEESAWIELVPESDRQRRVTILVPDSWRDRDGWTIVERGPTRCPTTGRRVRADAPSWPFADERARMADLYRWMSEGYQISRPIEQRDLEEGE